MFKFDIDTSAIAAAADRLRTEMAAATRDAVTATAQESLTRIQRPAYWRPHTGATGRSFVISVLSDTASRVSSSLKVAGFLNNGTSPHAIVARRAKFLRFVQNGAVRFARQVRHTGTKPKNFVDTEVRLGTIDLSEYAESALRRAIERSGLA